MSAGVPLVRLITRLNVGGPARQALLLTKHLAPAYDTMLAAGEPPPDEGELSDPAVAVRRVPLVRPLAPATDARAVAAVRRLLREHEARLLHTHMAKAGTIGRIAASTLRRRPATVHTFHGHVLEGYFRPALQRTFVEVERRLARRTDLLVAVSEEVRDDLLELGVGRPEQFRVVRLGLDLAPMYAVDGRSGVLRARLGLDDDVPLAGVVGRLAPIKDLPTMLRAWQHVPDAHLAVVGDGEQRAELEALVDSLGIADRVHFTGWIMDVPAVMADLDLVVLSSRNEGTPVSLIEAAAAGRAAVATDVGGVASVLADGETGLLVPAADPESLAGAVTALIADDGRRQALGGEARARASRFEWQRLVDDVRALYAELL